ncbi:MAG: hypothetical protein EP330_04795 [Deltaproteobacteria bacterium]|nr:MAG: hypothetical protein EP330_04795 [Deltaproteobacteria bacterium]
MTLRPLLLLGLATALAGCPYVGEQQYNDNIRDADGDGFVAERFGGPDCRDDDPSITICDEDGDGENSIAAGGTDCDDTSDAVGSNALEICNGIDDNCDGLIDDVDPALVADSRSIWYRDGDQDTFGNPDDTLEACAAPSGYIAVAGDCDDSRADVNPGANEFCDLVDHNCDGDLDFNAVDMLTYYIDSDGDGYGRDELSTDQGCPGDAPAGTSATNDDCDDLDADVHPNAPDTWYDGVDSDCAGDSDFDQDGDGALYPDEDCDDQNPSIRPGVAELCDGVDNDCDGTADEVEDVAAFDLTYYYVDADSDGAGGGSPIASCSPTIPSGHVSNGGDCDDGNPAVNPGGTEVCDGADNDCNGVVDDNAANRTTYYVDGDGDGFGDVEVLACNLAPGWSRFDGDCNDGDATVYPGAFEICGDAAKQDCDLSAPAFDCDGDGIDGAYTGNNNTGTDCDDASAVTYPGALEICDGEDNDCDGGVDNPPTEPVDNFAYYLDLDGDGFGAGAQQFPATCGEAVGMVVNNDDCNDLDANVNPNAGELCDGIDNNCDGLTDQGQIAEPRAYYVDADGDGAGDPGAAYAQSCSPPQDNRTWVNVGTDCNDADEDIGPGADEVCDGIDNDCDGLVDDQDTDTIGASWYADGDSDGFGAGAPISACSQPAGYVGNSTDCDDSRNDVNPGVPEDCNGYDDDCDGYTDSADPDVVSNVDWYPDADADGYGDSQASPVQGCIQPVNHVANNLDCNDSAASVSPAAAELCDGIDNDCDSLTDDADTFVVGGQLWYVDADQDGVGSGTATFACAQPVDTQGRPTAVGVAGDCDDTNAQRYPGNLEVCDGIDNDCDNVSDQDEVVPPVGSSDVWADGDGDGYGTGPRQERCFVGARAVVAAGWADENGDCNDGDAGVNPGIAVESCSGGVGLDNDCDGLFGTRDPDYDGTSGFTYGQDADGDGHGSAVYTIDSCATTPPAGYAASTDDCNDIDARYYPGMSWYADSDRDGFGDPNTSQVTANCVSPGAGWVLNTDDCNDTNGAISPVGVELCDLIDNDCDGLVDSEDDVVGGDGDQYWEDGDGDGWGDPATLYTACFNQGPPTTGGPWVNEGYDCDDTDPNRNPSAQETCNDGLDADCDGGDNTAFDSGVPIAGGTDYYLDADNDSSYSASPTSACSPPTQPYQGSPGDDCDDQNPNAYPNAVIPVGSTRAVKDLQDVLYQSVCDNTTFVLDAETFYGPYYMNGWQGLTVRGQGPGQTIIEGQYQSHTISDFGNNGVLEDLTLINTSGAGFVAQNGESVTIRNVDFGDPNTNPSFSAPFNAVGVTVYDSNVVLDNVRFFHLYTESAVAGGCIYVSGFSASVTMTDVYMEDCVADNGAAIYLEVGSVTGDRVTIVDSGTYDPLFGNAGVIFSKDQLSLTDLTYHNNGGVIWTESASGTDLTRVDARGNYRGVFESLGGEFTINNLRSINNGSSGYPAIVAQSVFSSTIDQATFVRDHEALSTFDSSVTLSNALFVDFENLPLVESNAEQITLDGAMSNFSDLSNVALQTNVTQAVPMTFQTYFHDPFGVSLPTENLDMHPTGVWNAGFGASLGTLAGEWNYSVDTDSDGLPDGWERWWLGDLTEVGTSNNDSDQDDNATEYAQGTLPHVSDTDIDGTDDDADTAPLNGASP